MNVELEAELTGLTDRDDSLRIRATGPYRSREGEFPDLDLDLDANAGSAQPVSLGFVSAGGRLFFKFAETAYELPVDNEQTSGVNPCGRKGLSIDPRPWVESATAQDDETIAGVETAHASGELDSDRMLRDLNDFIKRCSEVLGPALAAFRPLSQRQLDRAAKELSDPSFDVYVGKEDDLIRRLSARIVVEPTTDGEEDRKPLSLKFSIEFAEVNGDQKIEVPANVRPLSQLTSQLGVNTLRDGLGIGSQGSGQAPSGGDEAEEPAVDDFQNYADCLDRIDPDDTAGLDRCSALLNAP